MLLHSVLSLEPEGWLKAEKNSHDICFYLHYKNKNNVKKKPFPPFLPERQNNCALPPCPARFFNMELPTVAVSTGVAEDTVRGSTGVVMTGVRGVSHDIICARLDEWFCMFPQQSLELLAMAVREGMLVGDLAEVVKQCIAHLRAMQLIPVDTPSSTSLYSKSAPGPDLVTATGPSPLPQICTTCTAATGPADQKVPCRPANL